MEGAGGVKQPGCRNSRQDAKLGEDPYLQSFILVISPAANKKIEKGAVSTI